MTRINRRGVDQVARGLPRQPTPPGRYGLIQHATEVGPTIEDSLGGNSHDKLLAGPVGSQPVAVTLLYLALAIKAKDAGILSQSTSPVVTN